VRDCGSVYVAGVAIDSSSIASGVQRRRYATGFSGFDGRNRRDIWFCGNCSRMGFDLCGNLEERRLTEFKLHYHVKNNGDGSASVEFHKTEKEADKSCQDQEEGWGESSASHVLLGVREDGLIVRKTHDWNSKTKQWETEWVPLELVKVAKKKAK
jgi:hypothetical protein